MAASITAPFEQFQASGESFLSFLSSASSIATSTSKKALDAALEFGGGLSSTVTGLVSESLSTEAGGDILQRQIKAGEAVFAKVQTYAETSREIASGAEKEFSEIAKGLVPSFLTKFS